MESQVAVDRSQRVDLRKGFEAFIEAARRLEHSYADLKARADAVDLQLAETNRALDHTLAEREAIFAALPIGLLASGRDGGLIWRNPEAKRLCDLADRSGVDLADTREGEVTAGGYTVRVQRVDLPDRGELVILEDRSRVRHLEREVDRLDRLAGLSELALGIAHEIKNPLNGVMGFASLMVRTPELDTCRRYAGKIHQGLRQVDAIVKGLLAFARPQNKDAPLESVEAIALEAARCAGIPASRITTTGDTGELVESGALVRVLDNLFRNSRDAAGDEVSIRVTARADHGSLEISVSDDGPGVPAGMDQKIFEPFVSSKDKGHGLGLALASRVMAFLGGAIELVNPGEAGATFRVRVPRSSRRGR